MKRLLLSFTLSTVSKVSASSARKVLVCNTREQTGYYPPSISAGTLAKSEVLPPIGRPNVALKIDTYHKQ